MVAKKDSKKSPNTKKGPPRVSPTKSTQGRRKKTAKKEGKKTRPVRGAQKSTEGIKTLTPGGIVGYTNQTLLPSPLLWQPANGSNGTAFLRDISARTILDADVEIKFYQNVSPNGCTLPPGGVIGSTNPVLHTENSDWEPCNGLGERPHLPNLVLACPASYEPNDNPIVYFYSNTSQVEGFPEESIIGWAGDRLNPPEDPSGTPSSYWDWCNGDAGPYILGLYTNKHIRFVIRTD